jgi:hypothetical protein
VLRPQIRCVVVLLLCLGGLFLDGLDSANGSGNLLSVLQGGTLPRLGKAAVLGPVRLLERQLRVLVVGMGQVRDRSLKGARGLGHVRDRLGPLQGNGGQRKNECVLRRD